jgi:DNA polymerase phi
MRGPDVRDALFARLFGITSIIQSGSLFAPTSSLETFDRVIDNLLELGQAKGWLRESAWWGILGATEGVSQGNVEWAAKAVDSVVEKVYADKAWSQEKIALTLVLEARRPVSPLR